MMPSYEYIQVQPTTDPLTPAQIGPPLQRLHGLEVEVDGVLFGSSTEPLGCEFLLVSPPGEDPRLEYYVGCSLSDRLDSIERVCAELYPKSYDLSRTDFDLEAVPGVHTPVAGLKLRGWGKRRNDWMTSLMPAGAFYGDDGAVATPPLASVAAALAESPRPAVYQALAVPNADYSRRVDHRIRLLEGRRDLFWERLWRFIFDTPGAYPRSELPAHAQDRLAELEAKDARNTFRVTARMVVFDHPNATSFCEDITDEVASAFDPLAGDTHRIDPTDAVPAEEVWEKILGRRPAPLEYQTLATRIPFTGNVSPSIVADTAELPSFCLLDGDRLPAPAHQALAPTPSEQTTVRHPATDKLAAYRGEGFTIGKLDGTHDRLALPPNLQPLHILLTGSTGAGKSALKLTGAHDNHTVTEGADIHVLPKGDGFAETYARVLYASDDDLDDVYYYDCSECVPALSFFDIRQDLEAGVLRATAVEDRVDHFIELLRAVMGDTFDDVARSVDVIRYLVRAMFDPVHGSDQFTYRELHATASRMQNDRTPPAVSDPQLQRHIEGFLETPADMFGNIMEGAIIRIEKIVKYRAIARLFEHAPEEPADSDVPWLDLDTLLDEDAVILLDTGGLRESAQTALTIALLSQLWTTLRRRVSHTEGDELPLVNAYIDETASVADTELLGSLLAQSRSFGLSLTLAMQFPGQLKDASTATHREILNNVGTVISGPVKDDSALARRLATDDMPPDDVATRLRGLRRGQWLAALPAPFDEQPPRPFQIESCPLPAGHPDSDEAFDATTERVFQASFDATVDRTREHHGLEVDTPTTAAGHLGTQRDRVESALPYTTVLPDRVSYQPTRNAIACDDCEALFAASVQGILDAVTCGGDIDEIDRDQFPITDIPLRLDETQRAASRCSDRQLMFLQAVYRAQLQRFDTEWEYDLVHDSMTLLRDYLDIDIATIQELMEDGLLRKDCEFPHLLYTVTPDGRDEINVTHREGVSFGVGTGDVHESCLHVAMVELARRYLGDAYVETSASPAVEVVVYHDVGGGRRLDAAALDDDGNVVVAVEAERSSNNRYSEVPKDFDIMAACDPEEAIWIVPGDKVGHEVVHVLNNPADGDPRLEKTYSDTTRPMYFSFDTPGCTDIHTFTYVRDKLLN